MTRTDRSDTDRGTDDETLADVSHTPPNGTEDANRVFERGGEHDEPDDPEESDGSDGDGTPVRP
jgi:hypothetical protein